MSVGSEPAQVFLYPEVTRSVLVLMSGGPRRPLSSQSQGFWNGHAVRLW